jgi:hypothetical protein
MSRPFTILEIYYAIDIEHGCLVPDVVPSDHGMDTNSLRVTFATRSFLISQHNHKHKTYVSTSNVINSLSYTPQGYCMIVVLQVRRIRWVWHHGQSTVRRHQKKSTLFSDQYLRKHWTLDIGVLGYIGIVWPKEHSPEVRSFPPGTPCIKLNN